MEREEEFYSGNRLSFQQPGQCKKTAKNYNLKFSPPPAPRLQLRLMVWIPLKKSTLQPSDFSWVRSGREIICTVTLTALKWPACCSFYCSELCSAELGGGERLWLSQGHPPSTSPEASAQKHHPPGLQPTKSSWWSQINTRGRKDKNSAFFSQVSVSIIHQRQSV